MRAQGFGDDYAHEAQMTEKKSQSTISESTIARMAGNIAAGLVVDSFTPEKLAKESVEIARAIAAEVERTKPAE